jgi:hypothetical protein
MTRTGLDRRSNEMTRLMRASWLVFLVATGQLHAQPVTRGAGAAATAPKQTAAEAEAAPVQSIEYSDWYERRLTIHRWARLYDAAAVRFPVRRRPRAVQQE